MKTILLFLLPLALAAQEPALPEPTVPTSPISRSSITILPKARADDLMKAYELLKKEKPTFRISAHTFSGQLLSNISELTAMPNGTLLLFRLSTPQGMKYQFMPVEEILDLFYAQ